MQLKKTSKKKENVINEVRTFINATEKDKQKKRNLINEVRTFSNRYFSFNNIDSLLSKYEF